MCKLEFVEQMISEIVVGRGLAPAAVNHCGIDKNGGSKPPPYYVLRTLCQLQTERQTPIYPRKQRRERCRGSALVDYYISS